jgi:hypothetical protein
MRPCFLKDAIAVRPAMAEFCGYGEGSHTNCVKQSHGESANHFVDLPTSSWAKNAQEKEI